MNHNLPSVVGVHKVSDLIINTLVDLGIEDVFCVTGGASAHLLESVRKSGLRVIHNYHEQACAMAADAYARLKSKPALVLITNGPGVTNAITGVLGAYQDSIPMIILSGQVPTHHSIDSNNYEYRQLGIQEVATNAVVKSVVKKFIQLDHNSNVVEAIELSWQIANQGRKGPVWIEVPLDVQGKMLQQDISFSSPPKASGNNNTEFVSVNLEIEKILMQLESSKRPLIVVGNGVRLSNSEEQFYKVINKLKIPVVSSWNASDLFAYSDERWIGNFGILGQRHANIAIQESDFLLILGCRLSIPQIGHATELFSPKSYKAMVDIDLSEINKPTISIDLKIHCDLKFFLNEISKKIKFQTRKHSSLDFSRWSEILLSLKRKFENVDFDQTGQNKRINAYRFIEILGEYLPMESIVITDMGISFTCTMQNLRNNGGNRLFTSSGTSSMGFGLPGAIGAYQSCSDKQVICIVGDGGLQMNLQEIQTLVQYNIPIKLFILDSNGYLAISTMQDNLFSGNYFGSTPDSGVSSPDFVKIFNAYGLSATRVTAERELITQLESGILKSNKFEMVLIPIPTNQIMSPRVKSRRDESGQILSGSIDKMWPFLDESQELEIQAQLSF